MAKVKKSPLSKKHLLLFSVVVLGLAVGTAYYLNQRNHTTYKPSGGRGINKINYNPPTDEEKSYTEEHKEAIVDNQANQQPQPQPNTKKSVKPTISYADQAEGTLEIGAFITGLYEEGGTCTAQLSNGDKTVSQTSSSRKDATTTTCAIIKIPRSSFPTSGTWTLTVSYDSSTSAGSSDARPVEIK